MITILQADARKIPLADASVDCVVTSPPYWGLRDYGVDGQIGLEETFHEWLGEMLTVFAEVWRVLKPAGTLWVNMGDSYATGTTSCRAPSATGKHGYWTNPAVNKRVHAASLGLKPKDLIGQPWRLAFALQESGWYLRNDIIWHKPTAMPESCTDRATKAHEYLFLLAKSERYYFDREAWLEPVSGRAHARMPEVSGHGHGQGAPHDAVGHCKPGVHPKARNVSSTSHFRVKHHPRKRTRQNESFSEAVTGLVDRRNRRTVWSIPAQPQSEHHFAAFPEALIEPCILAGCPKGGTVLDPFCGSGTTLKVAHRLGRSGIGRELNPEYIEIARRRIFADVEPSLAEKKSGQRLLLA